MTTVYTGRLRPYPGIPQDWGNTKKVHARRVLDGIGPFAAPGPVTVGADIEDFWEDACRLDAAIQATGGHLLMADMCPEGADRLGPVSMREEGWDSRDVSIAHPLVTHHGGRAMTLGSFGGPGDVSDWFAALKRSHPGQTWGVLKDARHKCGLWKVLLDTDPEVVRDRIGEAMGWAAVFLEGRRDTLFAQQWIDMGWEYRLFVVDGMVVAGAGRVVENTPLDGREHVRFDPAMRETAETFHRLPSPVMSMPSLAEDYAQFCRTILEGDGVSGTMVVDVATDRATGDPVVVEVNSLPNAGLYAADVWAATEALMDATDRGYPACRPADRSRATPTTGGQKAPAL